jgi:glutamate synthase (NADPH/NADH) small chain
LESEGLQHQRGKISVHQQANTSLDGIFAGGDAVNGGKEVVDAVQAGKEGAAAIIKYLGIV